jgi:diaminopimelate epimerase
MHLQFFKYQGAGNDFVMIDNRNSIFDPKNNQMIARLCDRRFGIGADGLILLQNEEGYDFRMLYYNSDGFEASMCGNGARCIVNFARRLGIISEKAIFLAADGKHTAHVGPDGQVDLHMTDVENVSVFSDGFLINTGVPHFIQFVDDLSPIDVNEQGRLLRFDERFQPAGANVNFVKQTENQLTVHTYERGVECETLACGTGVTAAAIAAAYRDKKDKGEFSISAKGGNLSVRFEVENDRYFNVWLKGPADLVFDGSIKIELD